MQVKKILCTMALSCGLAVLPAFAQSSSQTNNPSDTSPTASPSPDQTSPSANSGSNSQQSSNSSAAADSSGIQSNVETALQKDDQLAGQSVNAQVSDKKITLTGNVNSQAQKDHAEQVAKQAAPGYTVKNKIKVSGNAGSSSSPMSEQPPKN
ncbi:MAG: BON domain-containing protein [Terriglobales bacterium]